jgi:hypothetical protein
MVGAFLIGARTRSWRWVVLPLLVSAPFVALSLILLVLGASSSPDAPGPMGTGGARGFLFAMGMIWVPFAGVPLLHALAAGGGVWWGKRQQLLALLLGLIATASLGVWAWVWGYMLVLWNPPGRSAEAGPTSVPLQGSELVCDEVAPEVVARIESKLKIPGGGQLRGARRVHSALNPSIWLVAADVQGAGYEGDDDIGVWQIAEESTPVTGRVGASSMVFTLNGLAGNVTTFPHPHNQETRNLAGVVNCATAAMRS